MLYIYWASKIVESWIMPKVGGGLEHKGLIHSYGSVRAVVTSRRCILPGPAVALMVDAGKG